MYSIPQTSSDPAEGHHKRSREFSEELESSENKSKGEIH